MSNKWRDGFQKKVTPDELKSIGRRFKTACSTKDEFGTDWWITINLQRNIFRYDNKMLWMRWEMKLNQSHPQSPGSCYTVNNMFTQTCLCLKQTSTAGDFVINTITMILDFQVLQQISSTMTSAEFVRLNLVQYQAFHRTPTVIT